MNALHFNTVGKLYLKYQLIFRVLFVNILLNDIFGGEKLICDTNQVGCNEMCVNRFAPITFKKLWELELWMVLIVTGVFIVFVFANQEVIKLEKNHHRLAKMMSVRKYSGFNLCSSSGWPKIVAECIWPKLFCQCQKLSN